MTAALEGLAERPKSAKQGALFGHEAAESVANSPPVAARGPGRPAGSQNRATRDRREFYLTRYSDPLEGAIAWALPADLLEGVKRALALAKLLKCDPSWALDFMRRCAADAMPFLHAKAVEMKIDGRQVHAHFGLGMAPPRAGEPACGSVEQLQRMFDAAGATIAGDPPQDLTDSESAGNSDA